MTSDSGSRPTGRDAKQARGEARQSGGAAASPERSSPPQATATELPEPLTFIQCGDDDSCDHDFQGWREFEDGLGGETVCAKCGIGAMEWSMRYLP